MEGALTLVGALICLGWLVWQVPTRSSTPELYDEYKKKETKE